MFLSKELLSMLFFTYCQFSNAYSNNLNADRSREPLILTDYIDRGEIDKARNLSQVKLTGINITSYSGFFRVNTTADKNHSSALFFWFFPAKVDASTAPVLVWLQGGPGASSMFGLFQENGPLMLNKSKANQTLPYLDTRAIHWSKNHNVIFIDNPVGTGFSFAEHGDLYSRNESHVGINLYIGIIQFFKIFKEYQNNPFYVTGESYAGKYVPALAYRIHLNNPVADLKINLKGIAIGNGYCDPVNMMVYSSYLYQLGLVDDNVRKALKEKEDTFVKCLTDNSIECARQSEGELWNIVMDSSNINVYNYIKPVHDSSDFRMNSLLNNNMMRTAIHVGDVKFSDFSDELVAKYLSTDILSSVNNWIETLLDSTTPEYKVLFYNGQLDIIVAYPLTVNFLKTLNWSGKEAYKTAPRSIWYYKSHGFIDVAGYVKNVKNFYEVLVRSAGHMVPTDQPEWALDLITKFTRNEL